MPQQGGGMPQQGGGMPQQGGFGQHPAFGGFINDPSTQLGLQMGQTAFNAGQQYIDQNVCLFGNTSTSTMVIQ